MIFFAEQETETGFDFDWEALARRAVQETLRAENCPFEAGVDLVLTDDARIREINRTHRGIDRATDVLSFPALAFPAPADFEAVRKEALRDADPASGAVWIGDIMISAEKVRRQAKAYGHGLPRELAFLIVHAMLHLLGYDHQTVEEEQLMEARQEAILEALSLTRGGGGEEAETK